MFLTHLSLTHFRTYTRLDMDVPRRIVLLVGDNAQGKTSILEAVYFFATFTSFHASSDKQLLNFYASQEPLAVARLVAEFDREGKHHRMEVRLIQEPVGPMGSRTRKEILVDGVKRTAQEALGIFNAVIFLPQMMTILEGGPDERRRYLNLAISQAIPGYARALSEYQQALTQRNALLKQLSERGGAPDQLLYWDEILADRGSLIIHARIAAIQEMERIAAEFHEKLTRREEVLRLVYQPAYDPARPQNGQMGLPIQTPVQRNGIPMAQIRQGFMERLSAIRGEEIARGMTTIGPHRDELRFLGNGRDLGDYGSRGQMRTALLALKLAEVQWLKQRTGQNPVLLLDEILAELDVQRRSDLLNTLLDVDQALFTTTDLNLFDPSFVEQCAVWRVSSGKVQPELD
ncbi:MAG TPA: DNA replication/repair protein RecF [Anaerolineaceae bacterium]|nr:DNA replication/repair protein RecF [Anaerolineaceae bacterium]HPA32085.1 DNA replication/repair protein RecF [Anaerolineaceae bacterium]HQF44961.1 DNA replication/repair protein RecF [Anaerolineaceae bacterium]HQH35078.1 DNA replication/repair protein RecF [Anaerolineaceae bacterium]HQJ03453.1 DNA replication/repair protein RecF [Anaerolineaceae bacterium]